MIPKIAVRTPGNWIAMMLEVIRINVTTPMVIRLAACILSIFFGSMLLVSS